MIDVNVVSATMLIFVTWILCLLLLVVSSDTVEMVEVVEVGGTAEEEASALVVVGVLVIPLAPSR
jgi:hypothetical protein